MSVFARIGNTDIVSTDTDTVPIQRYRQIQIIYRLIGATLRFIREKALFAVDLKQIDHSLLSESTFITSHNIVITRTLDVRLVHM